MLICKICGQIMVVFNLRPSAASADKLFVLGCGRAALCSLRSFVDKIGSDRWVWRGVCRRTFTVHCTEPAKTLTDPHRGARAEFDSPRSPVAEYSALTARCDWRLDVELTTGKRRGRSSCRSPGHGGARGLQGLRHCVTYRMCVAGRGASPEACYAANSPV